MPHKNILFNKIETSLSLNEQLLSPQSKSLIENSLVSRYDPKEFSHGRDRISLPQILQSVEFLINEPYLTIFLDQGIAVRKIAGILEEAHLISVPVDIAPLIAGLYEPVFLICHSDIIIDRRNDLPCVHAVARAVIF